MPHVLPIASEPKQNSGGMRWAMGGVVLALLVFGGIWVSQQRSQPSFSAGNGAVVSTAGSETHSPRR